MHNMKRIRVGYMSMAAELFSARVSLKTQHQTNGTVSQLVLFVAIFCLVRTLYSCKLHTNKLIWK